MVEGIRECAVSLLDRAGRFTLWNQAAADMLGYPATQVLGQPLELLYTEDDRRAGLPGRHLALAARHGVLRAELWRRRKDGSQFWSLLVITALYHLKPRQLLGFSTTTLDLSRHKLLEQREQERQEIDQILQAAESGTWKWDVGRDRIVVSRHLLHLLDYESEDCQMPFEAWLRHVHGAERAEFAARLRAVREQTALVPIEADVRLRSRDGRYHWFFMRANWHREDPGQAPLLMGVCVLIDHLKLVEAEQQRLARELDCQRARFATILEQLPSGVVLADIPSGKLSWQNQAARAMLGRELRGIDSYHDYARYHFVDASGASVPAEALPLARSVVQREATHSEDLTYLRADGRRIHFAITSAPIVDQDGEARLAVAVMHDVSELKQAQQAAAAEKERALVTVASLTDGVVTTDRTGVVTSVNPAAERFTGCCQHEAIGRPFAQVLRIEEAEAAAALSGAIPRCLAERHVITDLPHLTLHGADSQRYSVESAVAPVVLGDGELLGAVIVLHDVTESKRLLRRLGFEASHDALTGLVNRREFEARLQRTLERARHAQGGHAALLYMDLDQFKIVNDTCGHSAGDDLLKLLAQSYAQHVRERDTLARIGGDEFALIVEHSEVDEAMAVAHKILEATRNFRYACKGRLFQLGVSIGLTPIDRTTASVEEALRRADHACYIAKERGRNRVYVHYKGDLDFAQRRSDMHWVTRLNHAFEHDELQLYCQPIFSLGSEQNPQHYEILLRLNDAHHGPIGPGIFLAAAERYDVILKIDRWVLSHTLQWLSTHPEQASRIQMCSINLSRRSLADQSFHTFAAEAIDRYDVAANKLCFEITENGAIADMQKTIAFIDALSARGCRFSLDDFGTGMTSFSYLKQLPVDFIKIDGSFIEAMASNEVDFEMVRFTNDISHMMGRKTIAEYVSTPAIVEKLRAIGVDFAQGFWLGKPRPLAA